MTYQRKTHDEFQIHGQYSGQWEELTAYATRKEARENLKLYRENERGIAFKIIKKRIKNEEPGQ